jgi:hypothetical protein
MRRSKMGILAREITQEGEGSFILTLISFPPMSLG